METGIRFVTTSHLARLLMMDKRTLTARLPAAGLTPDASLNLPEGALPLFSLDRIDVIRRAITSLGNEKLHRI